MDRSRRNRRGRGHSYQNHSIPHIFTPPQSTNNGSLLNSLYHFFIMSCLITLIYLMLEYHCSNNCTNKSNVYNITKSIADISNNLSVIKNGYYDLELKILQFSQDLPKLEGQIDILEALAKTMERDYLGGWDPKTPISLPNGDVFLKPLIRTPVKNSTNRYSTPNTKSLDKED